MCPCVAERVVSGIALDTSAVPVLVVRPVEATRPGGLEAREATVRPWTTLWFACSEVWLTSCDADAAGDIARGELNIWLGKGPETPRVTPL